MQGKHKELILLKKTGINDWLEPYTDMLECHFSLYFSHLLTQLKYFSNTTNSLACMEKIRATRTNNGYYLTLKNLVHIKIKILHLVNDIST